MYYTTTGEDTIYTIIDNFYGLNRYDNPDEVKAVKAQIEAANPAAGNLFMLHTGEVLFLPGVGTPESVTTPETSDIPTDTDNSTTSKGKK